MLIFSFCLANGLSLAFKVTLYVFDSLGSKVIDGASITVVVFATVILPLDLAFL